MSMITATTWVPRGFAAPFPTKYVFDDEEYGRIAKLAKLQLEDAQEDLEEAQEASKSTEKKQTSSEVAKKTDEEKEKEEKPDVYVLVVHCPF